MIARLVLIVLLTGIMGKSAAAQETPVNLVGRLRVEVAGVEVRRVNTAAWLPVRVESIIGAGDSIRTGENGIAALNFFDGVLITSIQPASEIRLKTFTGALDAFALEVEAVRGFSDYSTRRTLNEKTRFQVTLPTFRALILTGELKTRVEADNRSAALNISRGQSFALWADNTQVELTPNTGVRLATGQARSEIVPATSFATLDSAFDGCATTTNIAGDVDINVRKSPSLEAERIGGIPGLSTVQAVGATGDGWTRIVFKDGYGWINLSRLPLDKSCAGLRRFPDGYSEP
jgi:hypothetical protein